MRGRRRDGYPEAQGRYQRVKSPGKPPYSIGGAGDNC